MVERDEQSTSASLQSLGESWAEPLPHAADYLLQQTPFALIQEIHAGGLPSALTGVAPEIPEYAMENLRAAAMAAAQERARLNCVHGDTVCPDGVD